MTSLRIRRLSPRELLVIGLPSLALVAGGFWLAAKFVKPAPPDRIVLSAGSAGGAYHEFAGRYAAILARDGVTLEVRPSAGSVENLQRLADPASDVEVAFVQGGIGAPAALPDAPPLVSLAAVAYEPLWIFVRGRGPVEHLTALKGRRLAIGPEGSGTRALALKLLDANGIGVSNALLPLGGQAALEAMATRRADAAFLVAAPESPLVQQLLGRKDVHVVHMAAAEAYVRRFPFLTRVTLPQHAVSFTDSIPPRDIALVSPTAFLVAREDTHPALVYLLLQAAAEVHRQPGLLQRAGEFPAMRPGDFAQSKDAERFFKQGPPLLQRVFPYWLANLVDRLWVLVLPLIAIVLPLVKIVPPLYDWRVRSKIFRRYGELRYIESEVERAPDAGALQLMLERVDRLEQEMRALAVPRAYSELFFNFRTHADLVRGRIRSRLAPLREALRAAA